MENIQNLKGIPDKQLIGFIKKCLEKLPDAKRVLVLFPDYTRIDFTDKIAPLIIKRFLSDKADKVDFLNAGGTHRKMSNAEISAKLGLKDKPSNISYYNHNFEDKDCLKTVGHIPREIVYKKTDGYLNTDIGVTVNRLIFSDYDLIIALSATVPHEAAGFSGGLKIFFPVYQVLKLLIFFTGQQFLWALEILLAQKIIMQEI
jgi:nickel-dependent lactate racemase